MEAAIPCISSEDVPDVRGVSLRFLSDFASKVPPELSTAQVVAKYIAPKCRGQPFTSLVSAKYTGPARHYVIHAHSCCFLSDLVVPLLQHFIGDPNTDAAVRNSILSSTFLHIDTFCCPQPPPPPLQDPAPAAPSHRSDHPSTSASRLERTDATLRACGSALLMLDAGGAALRRTRCLYEASRALALLGPQRLAVPLFEFSLDILYAPLQSLNLYASQASDPAEQRELLDALSRHFGGQGEAAAGGASSGRSGPEVGAAAAAAAAGGQPLRSPRLAGPLGAATRALISGIQDSLVSEAQQLIRAGVRAGPRYLACLRKAAEALRLGGAPLAEALAHAALKEHRRALGDGDAATLSALCNLALLRRAQGRVGEAEALLRQVLEGRRRLHPHHPDTAAACDQLAWLLQGAGRLEEAAELYREALRISEAALGPEHPDTASSANNLAGLLQSLGRLDEAEPLLKRSLAVAVRTLGARHTHTATAHNNLGVLYRSRGQLAEAATHFAAAYDITAAALGTDHPDTATSANNLALALQAEGRLREAEELLRQSAESVEGCLGPDHPSTRATLAVLANVLQELGQQEEAEALQRRLAGKRSAPHTTAPVPADPTAKHPTAQHPDPSSPLPPSPSSATPPKQPPSTPGTPTPDDMRPRLPSEPPDRDAEAAPAAPRPRPVVPRLNLPPPSGAGPSQPAGQAAVAMPAAAPVAMQLDRPKPHGVDAGMPAAPQGAPQRPSAAEDTECGAQATAVAPPRPPSPPSPSQGRAAMRRPSSAADAECSGGTGRSDLEAEAAAVKIQAYHRGRLARKQVAEMRRAVAAVAPVTATAAAASEPAPSAATAGMPVTDASAAHLQQEHQQQQQDEKHDGPTGSHPVAGVTQFQDAEAAAIKIQAQYRGRLARKQVAEMRRATDAIAVTTVAGAPAAFPNDPPPSNRTKPLGTQAFHPDPNAGSLASEPPPPRTQPLPASSAMAGLTAAAAAALSPRVRPLPGPQPLPSSGSASSPRPSTAAAAAPPSLPLPMLTPVQAGPLHRPPSRNAAICRARGMLLQRGTGTAGSSRGGSSSGGSLPDLCPAAPYAAWGPPDAGAGPPQLEALRGIYSARTRASGTTGQVPAPLVTLHDYFRAPEATLRATAPIPGAESPRASQSARFSRAIALEATAPTQPVMAPQPRYWVDAAAAGGSMAVAAAAAAGHCMESPRFHSLEDLQEEALSSALTHLRLAKAREGVVRSGAEARAVLRLKLEYIRLAVEQALSAVSRDPDESPEEARQQGEREREQLSGSSGPPPAQVEARRCATALPGDRSRGSGGGSHSWGAAGGAGTPPLALPGRPQTGGGGGVGRSASGGVLLPPVGEEQRRPANQHGMPRPALGQLYGSPATVEAAQGQLSGGHSAASSEDVEALMAEVGELRQLLLSTSNALSAAHRGLHHERAARQALASELTDLQRKLSAAVTTGRVPSARTAARLPSARNPAASGAPLSPSAPAPSPFASSPTAAAAASSSAAVRSLGHGPVSP